MESAKILGMSTDSLTNWENNRCNLQIAHYYQMRKAKPKANYAKTEALII